MVVVEDGLAVVVREVDKDVAVIEPLPPVVVDDAELPFPDEDGEPEVVDVVLPLVDVVPWPLVDVVPWPLVDVVP